MAKLRLWGIARSYKGGEFEVIEAHHRKEASSEAINIFKNVLPPEDGYRWKLVRGTFSMEAPKCRLCQKNHWAREGCYGMLMYGGPAGGSMKSRGGKAVDGPPKPAKAPADSAIAEKAVVGIPKPRRKKKAKKAVKKKSKPPQENTR